MMDMTGKLIIKAGLNDDIRRIPIHNEDITYDELILMMQRVFKGKLNSTDEILIKYKDEDGDLITLSDDSDLAFAIQSGGKILKITIFVNSLSDGHDQGNGANQKKEIKRQLKNIQQCLNDIVNRLEGLDSDSLNVEASQSPDKKKNEVRERESRSSSRCSGAGNVPIGSKEFDPLTGTQKPLTQSIPPISGSPRSGTPGSAASNAFLPTQGSPNHLQNSTSSTAPSVSQTFQNQSQANTYPPGIMYQNSGVPIQQHPGSGQVSTGPATTYAGQMQQQQPPQQVQSQDPHQTQQQSQQAQSNQNPYQNFRSPYQPYQGQSQPPTQQQQPSHQGASMYYPTGYPPQQPQQQPPTSGAEVSQQHPQIPQPQQPYGQVADNAAAAPAAQYPPGSLPPGPPGPIGPPTAVGGAGQNMYALGGLNSKQGSYRQGYR